MTFLHLLLLLGCVQCLLVFVVLLHLHLVLLTHPFLEKNGGLWASAPVGVTLPHDAFGVGPVQDSIVLPMRQRGLVVDSP